MSRLLDAVRGLATVLICTNRRLASADDKRVAFRWKDYRIDGPDRWKTMTLHSGANATSRRLRHSTALARVHPAVHVLPKGFHPIRHYGLFGTATAP